MCVSEYGIVSHRTKCMYEREGAQIHCIAVKICARLPGLNGYYETELPQHSTLD